MAPKVKFSVSIKELTFHFEGDHETGRSVQHGIENTLSNLVQSQSRALGIEQHDEPNVIDALPAPAANPPKTKRRRRTQHESSSNGVTPGGRVTCNGLITGLIDSGFFSVVRKVADVQKELTKKGHNYKSSVTSMALLQLTKKGKLGRDHDENGQFEYKAKK